MHHHSLDVFCMNLYNYVNISQSQDVSLFCNISSLAFVLLPLQKMFMTGGKKERISCF